MAKNGIEEATRVLRGLADELKGLQREESATAETEECSRRGGQDETAM